jgi:hypothetical protein
MIFLKRSKALTHVLVNGRILSWDARNNCGLCNMSWTAPMHKKIPTLPYNKIMAKTGGPHAVCIPGVQIKC